jgi:hypothetical protein
MIRSLALKAAKLGISAEVLMLTFSIGAVCGMLFEAILITVPKLAFALAGVLH